MRPETQNPSTVTGAGVPYLGVLLGPKACYSRGPPEELHTQAQWTLRQSQVLTISSLRIALSEERLRAYATQRDVDVLDSVARYQWNLALALALQPALHFLEICFRNHVLETSRRIVNEEQLSFGTIPCWLDAKPSLLERNEEAAVAVAKAAIAEARRPPTAGRLVARLNFGFWLSLCRRPYEQGRSSGPALWPALATAGFPFMKRGMRSRARIFQQLDEIRVLRNRISHHEPIWDRDIPAVNRSILEAISWMNLGLANVLAAESSVELVYGGGPSAFRECAVRHVKHPLANGVQ